MAARGGFADRTAGMTALFAGLLPPDVLARRSKAQLRRGVLQPPQPRVRAHAGTAPAPPRGPSMPWPCARTGSAARPSAQTFTLLQALWLARDRVEQPLGALAQ